METEKTANNHDFQESDIQADIYLSKEELKKREALSRLDNAKFGWFHVKACIVSGIDAPGSAKNVVPVYIDTLVKASAPVGTLLGQLLFGYLADQFGRKRMYGIELMIIVVATCASSLSATLESGWSVFTILGIWRIFLGLGIGGDYPLSAVITSEFATSKRRGGMMAAVFAMQGIGILTGCIVGICVLAAFKQLAYEDQKNLDFVWRICIGLGAIPACVAIYFRLTIPETPRYTIDIDDDIDRAVNDVNVVSGRLEKNIKLEVKKEGEKKATVKEFIQHFSQWKHFKVLLGTSMSWFALDVAFYGLNLNFGIVIDAIGFSGNLQKDPWNALYNNAIGNLIIALLGTVPGYWVSVFLIDKIGRKTIQIIGFWFLILVYIILGFAFNEIRAASSILFIVLFTIAQFFTNFGPNTTTFIVPGEVFPTRFRSTAHGISAAMGKLGAIISQVGFFQLKDAGGKNAGIPTIIKIFFVFMVIGLFFTYFIPETKGKTLEELENGETNKENIKRKNCFFKVFDFQF